MPMAFDESGNCQAAIQIDDLCRGSDLPRNLRVRTYRDNFSRGNRDGFDLRLSRIERHDFSIAQH